FRTKLVAKRHQRPKSRVNIFDGNDFWIFKQRVSEPAFIFPLHVHALPFSSFPASSNTTKHPHMPNSRSAAFCAAFCCLNLSTVIAAQGTPLRHGAVVPPKMAITLTTHRASR